MNVNQLHRVMPHNTVMFSKADVKTSSHVDRDSVVNGSCLKTVSMAGFPIGDVEPCDCRCDWVTVSLCGVD